MAKKKLKRTATTKTTRTKKRRATATPARTTRTKAARAKTARSTKADGPRRGAAKRSAGAKPAGRKARPYVYFFGKGKAAGHRHMKELLGGKGAGLAEMTNAGLPVPPGFTISTEACTLYYQSGGKVPAVVDRQMVDHLKKLERAAGAKLGSVENPLLVSVRSGAKFSMPGMMDTILNLGLNDESVEGLKRRTGNGRFAYDSYRRFVQMFGNVVLNVPKEAFDRVFDAVKEASGATLDTGLDEAALRDVVEQYKAVVRKHSRRGFPQDPFDQLRMARDAVFRSWHNARAVEYRRIYHIPEEIGTAVNVQMMVFGNSGSRSATGVGFTRNPATGAKEFYGEFLVNAQGEDVVAGVRTPQPIAELEQVMPLAYKALRTITTRLERHYKDVQDFEFTIEDDHLFMLQTRSGKRTGRAALVIATDLVTERLVSQTDALLLVDPDSLTQLLAPVFDPTAWAGLEVATTGLPASPGAASGHVVFTADDAVDWASRGKPPILVRKETVPDDIHGMFAAQGILTATGGMTSHAAVVGRQMGKPSVVGAGTLRIREAQRQFSVNGQTVNEGEFVSFDGLTGEVKIGSVDTRPSEILQVLDGTIDPAASDIYQRFTRLLGWADKWARLGVRANADQPDQASVARALGAKGIGLCRVEHMFFGEGRVPIVQRMILAENEADRRTALDELLPLQRQDFYELFKEMHGLPVTIRTIDPPLHEFLPKREDLMVAVAHLQAGDGVAGDLQRKRALLQRVEQLHEFNPMLGHRGVRLGVTYPEITEMQVRAIMEAACQAASEGIKVIPEIMIPLVGELREFQHQRVIVDRTAAETMKSKGVKVRYLVGAMIEVPRGAMLADEIASEAEFFSFGTNDLTQMTFGFSRDDAGKFLGEYKAKRLIDRDPFVSIDVDGVGQLVRLGVERGRSVRPNLKLGVCGEHSSDPASVHFFHEVGLDYVSASPYQVPVARLAAAHAALNVKVGD